MSDKFLLVQKYYNSSLWSKKRVYNAVKAGWITTNEYEQIVGEVYK